MAARDVTERQWIMAPGFGRRRQLSDEAASYIRDQITSGHLQPGARVRPEVVADELDISTTPAREALQALRAEGFLELTPRRGFTVARITGKDIEDIFFVQAHVAGELAARAAANATPQFLDRLDVIHADLTAAAARGDLVELERQNHVFHREINLAADAPRLAWVLQLVSRYAPRRFYASISGWPENTIEDHGGILEAIRSRDPARARATMTAHSLRAGELLSQHTDARLAGPEPRTTQADSADESGVDTGR